MIYIKLSAQFSLNLKCKNMFNISSVRKCNNYIGEIVYETIGINDIP